MSGDDPTNALQAAVRAKLTASANLTSLVPAENIMDRAGRPEVFPCILLGEGQIVQEGFLIDRSVVSVYLTMHIWKREDGLTGVKQIANVIRRVLYPRMWLNSTDYHLSDMFISDVRYLRDPNGELSHGVVTIDATIQDTWIYKL